MSIEGLILPISLGMALSLMVLASHVVYVIYPRVEPDEETLGEKWRRVRARKRPVSAE